MKALIVATSYKPRNFIEELMAGQRYRLEYLVLSEQLPALYMDYDTPWMHGSKTFRSLEERFHVDFFWARQIARKVREEKIDVVLSMSERIAVPLGIMLDPGVKHIVILLNAMAPKWISTIKLLKLQERWSHIITYSRAETEALQSQLMIGPEKISTIMNYVDVGFFNPVAVDENERPFVMSQGLAKRDYPTLIRAMRRLPHITCQVSAVSAWDKFKAGYEGMHIPANVQLKSLNHPSIIKNVMARSRFVVIPLRPDTGMWCAGSTSIMQAQAMGKPVVATYLPGITDYIRHGETGYVVKGNDPDALAEAIGRLWDDPQRAAEMGQAARQWICENFSLENWVENFAALLTGTRKENNVLNEHTSLGSKIVEKIHL